MARLRMKMKVSTGRGGKYKHNVCRPSLIIHPPPPYCSDFCALMFGW